MKAARRLTARVRVAVIVEVCPAAPYEVRETTGD